MCITFPADFCTKAFLGGDSECFQNAGLHLDFRLKVVHSEIVHSDNYLQKCLSFTSVTPQHLVVQCDSDCLSFICKQPGRQPSADSPHLEVVNQDEMSVSSRDVEVP